MNDQEYLLAGVVLGKYMMAMPPSNSQSGKTKEWVIRNSRGGEFDFHGSIQLGEVRWLRRWRCYAFFPFLNTVFNAACMDELSAFCDKATKEHKA